MKSSGAICHSSAVLPHGVSLVRFWLPFLLTGWAILHRSVMKTRRLKQKFKDTIFVFSHPFKPSCLCKVASKTTIHPARLQDAHWSVISRKLQSLGVSTSFGNPKLECTLPISVLGNTCRLSDGEPLGPWSVSPSWSVWTELGTSVKPLY